MAFESATVVASVAVVDGADVLGERVLRAPMRHLEWLLPAADGLLADLGLEPGAMEGVAVSVGPGSFTGLRVGIATAGGWARARGIPAVGVDTLEALAAQVSGAGAIVPILDAKRREVSAAAFRAAAGGPVRLAADVTGPPDEVLAALGLPATGPVVVLGDGIGAALGAVARAAGDRARLVREVVPRAAAVGVLAARRLARGDSDALYALQPRYGRAPAVRERGG